MYNNIYKEKGRAMSRLSKYRVLKKHSVYANKTSVVRDNIRSYSHALNIVLQLEEPDVEYVEKHSGKEGYYYFEIKEIL